MPTKEQVEFMSANNNNLMHNQANANQLPFNLACLFANAFNNINNSH